MCRLNLRNRQPFPSTYRSRSGKQEGKGLGHCFLRTSTARAGRLLQTDVLLPVARGVISNQRIAPPRCTGLGFAGTGILAPLLGMLAHSRFCVRYRSCNLHSRPFPAPCCGNPTLIQSLCDLAQTHSAVCLNRINHRQQISRPALGILAAHLCRRAIALAIDQLCIAAITAKCHALAFSGC